MHPGRCQVCFIPLCRSSLGSWAHDGVAGRRTGSAGVRAARAGTVRRSQTQDNRHRANRWVAADLRDRDGLRGRRTSLRLDAERARARICVGIRGSPCTAPRSIRSRAPRRSGRARRRSPVGRSPPDRSPRDRTATSSMRTSSRSYTPTSTTRPRCSSSSGGRPRTGYEGLNASNLNRAPDPRPPLPDTSKGKKGCGEPLATYRPSRSPTRDRPHLGHGR